MSYSYVEEDLEDSAVPALTRRRRLLTGLRACILAALRVLAFSSVTAAQSLTSGALHVRVTDETGRALGGADVRLEDRATGVSRAMRAEGGGEFAAPLLPAGDYDILVEVLGYRPQRWTGVAVTPGRAVDINPRLVVATPPVLSIEDIPFASVAAQNTAVRQFFPQRLLNDLPGERRELTELARLSSVMDPDRSSEGLPSSWTGLLIDGVRVARDAHTSAAPDPFRAAAYPLSEFAFAEIVRNDADVELASVPGPVLSAHTRTGTQTFTARTFGSFGSSALSASGAFSGSSTPGFMSGNGGVLLSGPILRDTAHFVIGIEAQRLERALPRLWELDDTLDARLLAIAQKSFALDLQSYTQPRVLRTDVLSGFARLDWQVASGHRLDVRTSAASMPRIQAAPITPSAIPDDVRQGSDLSASATLTSELTSRIAHELRVSAERTVRDAQPVTTDAAGIVSATTHIVQGALDFGGPVTQIGRFARTTVAGAQTLHLSTGSNRAKLGVSAALSTNDDAYPLLRAGEAYFGGLDEFARREGMVVTPSGPLRVAAFNTLDLGAYMQDTWTPAPGLSVLAGVRYDVTRLPKSDLILNQRWLQLTGLSNTQLSDSRREFSPRVAVRWDMGAHQESSLQFSAGIYHAPFDPGVIAELLTQDGSVSVRRAAGTLPSWPNISTTGAGAATGARLTLISPGFAAPKTSRMSVGLSQAVRANTALHISATLRRTEFLPRRSDLNAPTQAVSHDQYGRALFGALVQQGGLLFAKPGSNRRFSEFDIVSALTSDGTSNYWDVTIAANHDVGGRVTMFGSYTHSHTTDTWPTDRTGAPDASFDPRLLGTSSTEWSNGISDFDVPERLVLGVERRFGGSLHPRVAALYRYRSGSAFTPGFRAGVDANGDNFTRNDPAYIDSGIAGIESLLSSWKCLRTQINRFAARNSCREPGTHSLDLRVTSQVMRLGASPAELFVDALNIFDAQTIEPDGALLLIDSSRALSASGTATVVPFIANPHFGKPLLRLASGRALRIGLRVNY